MERWGDDTVKSSCGRIKATAAVAVPMESPNQPHSQLPEENFSNWTRTQSLSATVWDKLKLPDCLMVTEQTQSRFSRPRLK